MKKKKKAEVNAFYEMYKKEKGEKMYYRFKCENCGKAQEVEIAIKDYDKEKDKQECSCGGKLKRVIEWNGIATADGSGWFGKSDGSRAILKRGGKMTALLIYGGLVLFVVVVVTLAVITTKYSQKHNPDFWWA